MSGCGDCGSGSCSSSPKSSGGDCSCDGSCGDDCSCKDNTLRSNVRYSEVPLGLPEDHSGIKKPTDGLYVGMRVYLRGTKEYGVITEVRYKNCAVKIDDDRRTSVYEAEFIMPEHEGKGYTERCAALLSPAPPDPFED